MFAYSGPNEEIVGCKEFLQVEPSDDPFLGIFAHKSWNPLYLHFDSSDIAELPVWCPLSAGAWQPVRFSVCLFAILARYFRLWALDSPSYIAAPLHKERSLRCYQYQILLHRRERQSRVVVLQGLLLPLFLVGIADYIPADYFQDVPQKYWIPSFQLLILFS